MRYLNDHNHLKNWWNKINNSNFETENKGLISEQSLEKYKKF